ncbi:nuclease-related domain-containing protein [Pseudarthrobacter sp. H2]|uniref:nuclease-related domain-containing protein n=1 Tax=Pseudarthrobacter sp. H2 TaxID=3418415 RepID=UPI003CFAA168
MAAGDGAAEQSRRATERVARLRRELEQAERNVQSWSVGATGEAMVATKTGELAASGWSALHDVHWPGRPKANLDHILIGPGGIVVVDAKNWSGNVQAGGGRLRQNGYRKDREVLAASEQGAAVAALLEPHHRLFVRGWICLVAQPNVDEIAGSAVRILGLDRLCPAVAGLPPVLDGAEVQVIHAYLNEQLAGPSSPRLLTTAQLTTAQFASADAPAASLQQWRNRAQAGASQDTPLGQPQPGPSMGSPLGQPQPGPSKDTRLRKRRLGLSTGSPRRKRRGKSRGPSWLELLLQLTLLIVGASMLMNFASSYRPAAPSTPRPSPTVSQTLPAR